MKNVRLLAGRGVCLILSLFLLLSACLPALAEGNTLRPGMEGEEVREMQQALIDQGYLSGSADGKYGTRTENAVRKFQKKHKLWPDGLAGQRTLAKLYAAQKSQAEKEKAAAKATAAPAKEAAATPTPAPAASDGLFGGDYSTLRPEDSGERVRTLQQALIRLNYLSGSADGKYGGKTQSAVFTFQRKNGLKADGVAGRKTLTALEKAVKGGEKQEQTDTSTIQKVDLGSLPADAGRMAAPSAGDVRLLHWYTEVKPQLKYKSTILIYDPSSGLSWHLRVYSRGRHLDAEPLTLEDTMIMMKAFGGKNTWNPKGVYVKLPGGTWTLGSTHDMPHLKGSISDNGFDGHLCVHFLRDMAECEEKDPNYGVSNQRVIRALWKRISGETLDT